MAEPYIKQLQNERRDLIAYARAVLAWKAALEFARITGRKGSAYQEVDRKEKEMDEAFHKIEPLVAD